MKECTCGLEKLGRLETKVSGYKFEVKKFEGDTLFDIIKTEKVCKRHVAHCTRNTKLHLLLNLKCLVIPLFGSSYLSIEENLIYDKHRQVLKIYYHRTNAFQTRRYPKK